MPPRVAPPVAPTTRWPAFYAVVRDVPRGRVTTYGQVALLAGSPGYARHVGLALAALRGTRHRVPWQRVLGKASARRARIAILDPVGAAAQRLLLEREGVEVDARGRVDLEQFGWPARAPTRATRPSPASRPRSRGRTRRSSGRS
jgi:methylated-DNA-protein-cysteine methyltransferase related protein